MTARAWLPEPPCDICTVYALAGVGEPLGDELLVELAIQLARRIVRHVQDLDRAVFLAAGTAAGAEHDDARQQ